jgi:lysophospholipase L1-like esterase
MGCFSFRDAAVALSCGAIALAGTSAFAITPNKLVSGGLKAYTGTTTTDYLTDGYLTNWKSSNAKEIALNVGEGPKKLLINWESYGDCAWATDFTSGCGHSGVALSNFKILTSANSTDGSDGDWTEAASIVNNPVMARGVEIDFAGKSWFKFVSEGDVGQILEIEAFDISAGGTDTWFFMGTSISQMGIKQQDTDSTTAQLIHARFPEYTPAMLRGGIGCINSTEVVEHLGEYLEYAGNVKFWAIEMGTNDAWGGGDWNLQTYVDNMQTIVDSAKAHGITPVIARIIATDSSKAGWQINPAYLDAVDKLVSDNGLPAGPDFYSYFREHPELLGSDGVHPNSNGGGQAMHHLWAEALAPLYAVGDTASGSSGDSIATDSGAVRLEHAVRLRGDVVTVGVYDMMGHYLGIATQSLPQGLYIVRQKVQNRVVNKVFLKK